MHDWVCQVTHPLCYAVRLAAWRAVAVAATAAAFFLFACSDDGDGALGVPPATVATAPAQTTTTNPFAVPPVIDAAYVNRVLAGLDAAFGDIMRELVRTQALPQSTLDRLKGIYGSRDLLNLAYEGLQVYARFNLQQLPQNPGNKVTTVSELISADRSCIYASVLREYTAFSGRAQPPRNEWVALTPLDSTQDILNVNPTGWTYVYEGADPEGRAPRVSPCSVAA